MRLPLAIPLDARTGAATKDARLTNAVVENYEGRLVVSPRPGLSQYQLIDGTAGGIIRIPGSGGSSGTSGGKAIVISDGVVYALDSSLDATDGSPGVDTSWASESSNLHANGWSSIVFGNGLFVAVGYPLAAKQISTSTNGLAWTQRDDPAGVSANWVSVTYGAGRYVAVSNNQSGANEQIISSPDGITWTLRSDNGGDLARTWQSVTYGGGTFVAIGASSGPIAVSEDGETWSLLTTNLPTNTWKSIAYGNGVFVAVSSNGTNRIAVSDDLETWTFPTAIPSGTMSWNSVIYANEKFVAVGAGTGLGTDIISSVDGVTWVASTLSIDEVGGWTSIAYGGGVYAACRPAGTDRITTSRDGRNWYKPTSVPVTSEWSSVAYGNGLFVAVSGLFADTTHSTRATLKKLKNIASVTAGDYR